VSYDLLLTRSITHAQRMSAALEKAGIPARYFRPPMALTQRGCGYAVRVAENRLSDAIRLLRGAGLEPVRVYQAGMDGTFRELAQF